MNGPWRVMGACLLTLCISFVRAAEPLRVVADRVNIRARPDTRSEVVAQVNAGDTVMALNAASNWVEILPPEAAALWVHKDFVRDGRVIAGELNVRGGPGINYSVVGSLRRGDDIRVLETFGEWLRVASPSVQASVWISRDYLEPVAPPPPPPAFKAQPPDPPPRIDAPLPVALAATPEAPEQTPPPPEDWPLIPLEGQGRRVQREGILRRAGLFTTYPSRYRLDGVGGDDGRTLCFIYGSADLLGEKLGRRMLVEGHEYWVRDADYPVVVPKRIALRARADR